MSLSDKIQHKNMPCGMICRVEDVKEFIKELKEEFPWSDIELEILDRLAGDKLI